MYFYLLNMPLYFVLACLHAVNYGISHSWPYGRPSVQLSFIVIYSNGPRAVARWPAASLPILRCFICEHMCRGWFSEII